MIQELQNQHNGNQPKYQAYDMYESVLVYAYAQESSGIRGYRRFCPPSGLPHRIAIVTVVSEWPVSMYHGVADYLITAFAHYSLSRSRGFESCRVLRLPTDKLYDTASLLLSLYSLLRVDLDLTIKGQSPVRLRIFGDC